MVTALDTLDPTDHLPAISLEAVLAEAELQIRIDRKYVLSLADFQRLSTDLGSSLWALEIDGRRWFGYRSVYFDTPRLRSFHQHLQGRRRRFKVRTRTYLDSGDCLLEVKSKGARSQTVKARLPYEAADADRLTETGRGFVAEQLGGEAADVDDLRPVLETRYRRATLVHPATHSRITCDVDLVCASGHRGAGGLRGEVLVETKSAGPAGGVDRWLRRHGVRPLSISKYCVGVALLYPHVRANPWHRTLRRHFEWAADPRAGELPAQRGTGPATQAAAVAVHEQLDQAAVR